MAHLKTFHFADFHETQNPQFLWTNPLARDVENKAKNTIDTFKQSVAFTAPNYLQNYLITS
jgi:hypothetical protein